VEVGTHVSAASGYLPIADHGLIGDLHSAALVGTDGTIDWYCCPRFDAPSVFGAILDAERGGCFELAAAVPARTRQFYFPDTNLLMILRPRAEWERFRTSCRSPLTGATISRIG
jgi:GH15 family glucan-1,4-alpha-glucosidase